MGTGATALAAIETGRVYVGYEIEDQYATTLTERVADYRADDK